MQYINLYMYFTCEINQHIKDMAALEKDYEEVGIETGDAEEDVDDDGEY